MLVKLRTMTFVPGYRTLFLQKATSFSSDALILDIEDSVPNAFKEDARRNIRDFLDSNTFNQKIFVRLNSLESGLLEKDLEYVVHPNVYGFMPTMIKDKDDLIRISDIVTKHEQQAGLKRGRFKFCPLIETVSAVLNAYQIGSSVDRLVGLAFGAEDFLSDLDGLHHQGEMSILTARSMVVFAARALKLEALDTPYLDIRDKNGFEKNVKFSRELGFSGRLIIHPTQIDIANNVFTPSDKDVANARQIIAAIEESSSRGEGVTLIDGSLVGPPMEKRARKLLEKWEALSGDDDDNKNTN